MTSPYLSIIIPAYNEERRLPRTLEQVFHFLARQDYEAEILVVENGSNDRTFELAQSFKSKYPNLRVLQNAQAGKGKAVQRGMLEARGAYRIFCDADLSMPIEEVASFITTHNDADIVIASREAEGAIRYDEPEQRHITGRVFNFIIRILAVPRIQDTQCGFKGFRADVAEDLFQHQSIEGWAFDVEILYIANLRGYEIIELPIPWYYRQESKISVFRDSLRMLLDILKIRRNACQGLYAQKEV